MNPSESKVGFFPNLISLLFFLLIMGGMFYGFTTFYPQLAMRAYEQYLQTSEPPPLPTPTAPTVDQSIVQLAPLVRGTLSGVQAAFQTSKTDTRPLDVNKTQGYLKGMKTALITSRDWYDLDRQLFKSRGLYIGVQASIDTSKPNTERSTLEYQIKLVQQIQQALSVNLDELLSSNSDRARVLTNYLDGLKQLASESATEVENMQRIVSEYQGVVDENLALSQQASDAFVNDTNAFITDNIDANFNQFLEGRKLADQARIRVTSTSRVLQTLQPLAARLPTFIQAIEANFDALASGIKITPTPGVNLPLIQQ